MRTARRVITGPVARRWLALPAAILLIGATVAAADDFPVLKPGLWEFKRTLYLARIQGEPPTQTIQKCANPTEEMKKKWEQLATKSCRFSPIAHDGNRYMYRSLCQRDDRAMQMSSTVTRETDSDYRVETESVAETGTSREVVVAHRVGDCAT